MSQITSRRFVLQGLGAAVSLPLLESVSAVEKRTSYGGLREITSSSSTSSTGAKNAPLTPSGIPRRMIFIPMGYGVSDKKWFPTGKGENFEFPELVKPFEPYRDQLSFIQNLGHPRAGDAHFATVNFLRGSKKGISCDQVIADFIGKETQHNYITMGRIARANGHGSLPSFGANGKVGGYGDYRRVYNALFGGGNKTENAFSRLKYEESVLDAVIGDARRLQSQVSAADKDRIDAYFDSIRSIEKRISKAQKYADRPKPNAPFEVNQLNKRGRIIDLVFDMMVAALQSDSTRVMTYCLPTEAVLGQHPHRMSHKPGSANHIKRDLAFSKAVARFLGKLKETEEPDGSTLLDNSLVSYGTSLRKSHSFGNIPFILAGGGGGGLKQGQNIRVKSNVTAVWYSLIRHIGIDVPSYQGNKRIIKELGFS